jgi:hypothetical protein
MNNKLNFLENLNPDRPEEITEKLQDELSDELSLLPRHDLNRKLTSYFCGIQDNQVFTFRFQNNGKVHTWVQHAGVKSFKFPPASKPQFIRNYHIANGNLFWSVNIFGNTTEFKAPLRQEDNPKAKIELLKSKETIFSSLSCTLLEDLLSSTKVAP